MNLRHTMFPSTLQLCPFFSHIKPQKKFAVVTNL